MCFVSVFVRACVIHVCVRVLFVCVCLFLCVCVCVCVCVIRVMIKSHIMPILSKKDWRPQESA